MPSRISDPDHQLPSEDSRAASQQKVKTHLIATVLHAAGVAQSMDMDGTRASNVMQSGARLAAFHWPRLVRASVQ